MGKNENLRRRGTASKQPSPLQVINVLEHEFHLSHGSVTGPSRSRQITRVRGMCAHVLRERFNLSWPEIGAVLNKHHATPIKAVKKLSEHDKQVAISLYSCYDENKQGFFRQLLNAIFKARKAGGHKNETHND